MSNKWQPSAREVLNENVVRRSVAEGWEMVLKNGEWWDRPQRQRELEVKRRGTKPYAGIVWKGGNNGYRLPGTRGKWSRAQLYRGFWECV